VTIADPGHDEIVLSKPGRPDLCNSRACVRAGRLADVVVSYGVLNDRGATPHDRAALWPESWGHSVPMCAGCWATTRPVAERYRPGLVIRDLARGPGAQQSATGTT
jgi:hypothetical protein